jgi:hypothetical protein
MKSLLEHLNAISATELTLSDVENGELSRRQNTTSSSARQQLSGMFLLKKLNIILFAISNNCNIYLFAISALEKRRLVGMKQKIERCEEELKLLEFDMESYLKYYYKNHLALKNKLCTNEIFTSSTDEVCVTRIHETVN